MKVYLHMNWILSDTSKLVDEIHNEYNHNPGRYPDANKRVAEKSLYQLYLCTIISEFNKSAADMAYLTIAERAGIIDLDLIERLGYEFDYDKESDSWIVMNHH